MSFTSKKTPWLLLAITAFACSRTLFFLFNDPEGPNLLIVTVLAAILYFPALIAWAFIPSKIGHKRLLVAVCVQIIIITGLYTLSLRF
jgi:hypothetical protein